MASTEKARKKTAEQSVGNNDSALWRAFANPRTDNEFYQAWLALLCPQLPEVTAGIVLLRSGDANTFMPVAVWPSVARDLSFLGTIAQRALTEARGVVHHTTEAEEPRIHVAYPIDVSGLMLGAVVLEAGIGSDADVNALQRKLHWNMGWLHVMSQRRELATIGEKTQRLASVMEAVATALRSGKLKQILFALANHLARQAACSRVAIGLTDEGSVHVAALSNAAWFEKNTNIVKLYAAAMEETLDRLTTITYSRPTEEGAAGSVPIPAHAELVRESGAQSILSVPLQLGAKCVGALTLERTTGTPFSSTEVDWAEALASLLPAVIEQKRLADRGYLIHLRDDTKKLMTRLFGPRYLVWKFSASLFLVVIAVLALVATDYRVTAKTVIEGEVQRAAVAPFEGYVAASYVRAGDIVKEGQVLCELDNRDLQLEQHKRASEREQQVIKLREAMANHDLAQIQVLSAQVQQADAQLGLARERVSRSVITAPFEGVVISGDLSQLVGSPVEQGKKLFEIAPLEAYRVILQVDEREIGNIQVGQTGTLVISGIAGDPIRFDVINLTPVATAQDGRNFFRVEARLKNAPARLRPGMEGVGKVAVGERRLWWILTHSFTDWLRLSLWKWMP